MSVSLDENWWRNWRLFSTHLVSSPVFSLDCHTVALWRWGWGSVFDIETCCSWGRVCACWRSAGWPADPSLPCAVGSASWRGRPSCCAQLTQVARRASLSRQPAQPPRMINWDANGAEPERQKWNKSILREGAVEVFGWVAGVVFQKSLWYASVGPRVWQWVIIRVMLLLEELNTNKACFWFALSCLRLSSVVLP